MCIHTNVPVSLIHLFFYLFLHSPLLLYFTVQYCPYMVSITLHSTYGSVSTGLHYTAIQQQGIIQCSVVQWFPGDLVIFPIDLSDKISHKQLKIKGCSSGLVTASLQKKQKKHFALCSAKAHCCTLVHQPSVPGHVIS